MVEKMRLEAEYNILKMKWDASAGWRPHELSMCSKNLEWHKITPDDLFHFTGSILLVDFQHWIVDGVQAGLRITIGLIKRYLWLRVDVV